MPTQKLTAEIVTADHLLSQTLLSLHTAIQQNGATVTSDPLPTVVAKEGMLTQIFQNLIGNSIKYRSEAAPTIHISAERTAEGNGPRNTLKTGVVYHD